MLARDALAKAVEIPFDNLPVRKKTRARSTGGVSRQAGKAAAAASAAAFTSAAPPAGHSAITSPVEGLKTGVVGSLGSIHSPLMNSGQRVRGAESAMIGWAWGEFIFWSGTPV